MVDITSLDWYEQIAHVYNVSKTENLAGIMSQLASVPTWLIYPLCVKSAELNCFPKISAHDICLFANCVRWPSEVISRWVVNAFDRKSTNPNRYIILCHLSLTQRTTLHNHLTEYAYIAQRGTARMHADGMPGVLIDMLREVAVAEGLGRFLPP